MADDFLESEKALKETPAESILNAIEKGDPIRCDHEIIKGDLDIGKLDLPTENGKIIISSRIEIIDSRIYGYASFANAVFKNDFDASVDFSRTIFHDRANFRSTVFCQGAEFVDAEFRKKSNFGEAKFCSAIFTGAKFNGYADFMKAKFYECAIFDGIQFYNYANFVETRFNIVASFHWAFFNDYANFSGARFRKRANFNRTRFGEDADFRRAIFENDFSLNESSFKRLHIRWEIIKDHLRYDGAVYLSLIKNFKNLEFYDDADNCYYQYRVLAQRDKNWYPSPNKSVELLVRICEEIASYPKILYEDLRWLCFTYPPFYWICRFNWSKLFDQISRISCGYGVKVSPIILWMIGLSLVFAFAYFISGGIGQIEISETTKNAAKSVSMSIFDSVYFSVMVIIGKLPTGFNPIGGWKYIVMIESFLGYLLMALFAVVLVRKLIR